MMKGENMYQLTKEGEKNVSEFVEECRKRYKKISEYYRALSGHYTDCVDHVELPTREIILHEINSGERFLEDVWCVGDKYYMSDWCLSKKHNICLFGTEIWNRFYQNKEGNLFNADLIGAGNILRKKFPEIFSKTTDFSFLQDMKVIQVFS